MVVEKQRPPGWASEMQKHNAVSVIVDVGRGRVYLKQSRPDREEDMGDAALRSNPYWGHKGAARDAGLEYYSLERKNSDCVFANIGSYTQDPINLKGEMVFIRFDLTRGARDPDNLRDAARLLLGGMKPETRLTLAPRKSSAEVRTTLGELASGRDLDRLVPSVL